ncbi:hypothetical protein ABEB36_008292 [Hypothenemus hampei]|uniref:BMP and activin membrane-bound inhibitor homolog n=1 Tax=Hypothenemus hampei TaxID=57062 RepID=A0ABD1ELZ8_HYPHA
MFFQSFKIPTPLLQVSFGHVRCFCNLPPCVLTGYMCKSSIGLCFSDLQNSTTGQTYRGRHGCIEYLTESQRDHCSMSDNEGQLPKNSNNGQEKEVIRKSLLVCCANDMCNHVDNPLTKNLLNSTSAGSEETVGKFQHQQDQQEDFLYTNSEVWFRAATIAVPICGAVILFALIALAVKILKNENNNSFHHKLGSPMYVVPSENKDYKWSDNPYKPCSIKRPYYSQTHPHAFSFRREDDGHLRQFQMPLLISRELNPSIEVGVSKNDTNAKMNLKHTDSNTLIMEIEKSTPDCSLAANMNLSSDDKFCKNEKTLIS